MSRSFCLDCPKKVGCKEICSELEKILPKARSGGHEKEYCFDPHILDTIILKSKERGFRKTPVQYDDNWETP